MTIPEGGSAAGEWRQHWGVVLGACTGVILATVNIYSTGLFAEPLQQEFGWSRAEVMSAHLFPAISGMILSPFLGIAIDRVGPRRIGMAGASLFLLLTGTLALSGPSIWSWWTIWAMLSLANVMVGTSVWAAGVVSVFSASRGFALAVTLCGSGIGSMLMPLIAYNLIERLGWRMAFVAMAALWAAIALPIIWLFFSSAIDIHRARARGRLAGPTQPLVSQTRGVTRANLLSALFLRLLLGTFLVASVIIPIVVSIVPILQWNGISRGQAAGVAASLGVASIAGRLLVGFLLDRFHGTTLAAISVCLPIVAVCVLLSAPGSVAIATLAACILGVSLGAEYDIVAYLTSRYFSLRNFGLFFATIGTGVGLASGLGPAILGAVYDNTGSYFYALIATIPMCIVSALLFLSLGPYPPAASDGIVQPLEP